MRSIFTFSVAVFLSFFGIQSAVSQPQSKVDLVKSVQAGFSRIANARIQAKRVFIKSGKVSETYDITIGDDLNNCRCLVEKFSSNKRTGKVKTEWIRGGGQWISNTELELQDSIFYTGDPEAGDGFLLKRNAQPSFVFGYLQNQDVQYDLTDPEFFKHAINTNRKNSRSLTVEDRKGSVLRFDFDTSKKPPRLTRISLKFDGKAVRPSGKFHEDSGKPIMEQYDSFSEIEWREIAFDKLGRFKKFSVFYRDSPLDDFTPAVRYEIERIEPSEVTSFFPFKFHGTKAPVSKDVFVISDPKARYKFEDGKIQKVVDEQADKIIKELREDADHADLELATNTQNGSVDSNNPKNEQYVLLEPYLRVSSSRHCGVYAAAAVAEKLGKKIDLAESICDEYISRRSGSSAQDLVRFFESNGLHAYIISGAGPGLLKKIHQSGAMAILHQSASYKAEGSEHWIAFFGLDHENATILDLPRRPETISIAELQSGWNGNAVVVSQKPVSLLNRVFQRMEPVPFLIVGVFVFVVAVLVRSVSRIRNSTGLQAACLVTATMIACVIWQTSTNNSLIRNQFARNVVASKVVTSNEVAIINEIGELASDTILVDARPPSMYARKSIPNAINIPIDFSLSELKDGLGQLEGKSRIIVYCNSDRCKWAENLCYRLQLFGIENCQVYEPGMAGYFAPQL